MGGAALKTFLDDFERALTDLLQMGIATAGPALAKRFARLGDHGESTGAHTGASLCSEIAALIEKRTHDLNKTDQELTAAVFRAGYYITLCRDRMTEEDIRHRWQEGGSP